MFTTERFAGRLRKTHNMSVYRRDCMHPFGGHPLVFQIRFSRKSRKRRLQINFFYREENKKKKKRVFILLFGAKTNFFNAIRTAAVPRKIFRKSAKNARGHYVVGANGWKSTFTTKKKPPENCTRCNFEVKTTEIYKPNGWSFFISTKKSFYFE